jgi:hypothetical protein
MVTPSPLLAALKGNNSSKTYNFRIKFGVLMLFLPYVDKKDINP